MGLRKTNTASLAQSAISALLLLFVTGCAAPGSTLPQFPKEVPETPIVPAEFTGRLKRVAVIVSGKTLSDYQTQLAQLKFEFTPQKHDVRANVGKNWPV